MRAEGTHQPDTAGRRGPARKVEGRLRRGACSCQPGCGDRQGNHEPIRTATRSRPQTRRAATSAATTTCQMRSPRAVARPAPEDHRDHPGQERERRDKSVGEIAKTPLPGRSAAAKAQAIIAELPKRHRPSPSAITRGSQQARPTGCAGSALLAGGDVRGDRLLLFGAQPGGLAGPSGRSCNTAKASKQAGRPSRMNSHCQPRKPPFPSIPGSGPRAARRG